MLKNALLVMLFITTSTLALSQGTIRGIVKDYTTNDPIPFAKVKAKQGGSVKGGDVTDFDGSYSISVPGGKYTLVFSSTEGHIDQETAEISVVNGEVNVWDMILTKDSSVLEVKGVTVVAIKERPGTSQEEVDKQREKAEGTQDGVGRDQMKKTGAGNAAEGISMAPGISVEGGKRVYVRGLGDRYTKTILNGIEIPGLDPDRNAVQLDIFPSTVIDNITVYKTFLPNLTGEFTGGLVDITTRDFPAERILYWKGGLGYNTQATFNSNYIGYDGGSMDFLGIDDGTRALPFSKFTVIPDAASSDNAGLETILRTFNPQMATTTKGTFMDQNYAFNIGNQFNKVTKDSSKITYGYNFVFNYRNNYRLYEGAQFNEFRKQPEFDQNLLFRDRTSLGTVSENNVLWSTLIGQSLKFKRRNKISLTLFHTQNGTSSGSYVVQENFDTNPAVILKDALQYTQRSISTANLSGLHYLDTASKWRLDWKLTPTIANVSDPDLRSTTIEENTELGDTVYLLAQSVGAEIRRIYRNLREFDGVGRMDLTYDFMQWDSLGSTIKFGFMNTNKRRSFSTYDLNFSQDNMTVFSDDPDWYFQNDVLWSVAADSGIVVKGQEEPANNFEASINVIGAYIMNDLPITKRFKATYGARLEHALYQYTGQNNLGTEVFNDSTTLNQFSLLPSVNLVYKIEKDEDSARRRRVTNWRMAYTQTVARPSFREKSIANIFDPIQGRRYNGNMDLVQTTIHNADLRWEYFFGRVELLSASGFYKRFINPIEVTTLRKNPRDVQPINAGVAEVFGAEVEMRKSIGFNDPKKPWRSFVLGANFTYVVSRVDMNQVLVDDGNNGEITQKEDREQHARTGETIGDYRPMFGQSPYIVNGFLTFQNDSLSNGKFGLIMNVSYNVQGKRLAVIGVGQLPDVWEQPFHSLNFKASFRFGESQQWKGSIAAQNVLLNTRRRSYESYGDKEALEATLGSLTDSEYIDQRLYDSFYEGITVTASISCTISGKKAKKKK